MWSSPAATRAASLASSRGRPDVIRLTYRPAERAAPTSSMMSGRASGSPPVKSTCRTPAWAASWKTREQDYVENMVVGACQLHGIGKLDEQRRLTVREVR